MASFYPFRYVLSKGVSVLFHYAQKYVRLFLVVQKSPILYIMTPKFMEIRGFMQHEKRPGQNSFLIPKAGEILLVVKISPALYSFIFFIMYNFLRKSFSS